VRTDRLVVPAQVLQIEVGVCFGAEFVGEPEDVDRHGLFAVPNLRYPHVTESCCLGCAPQRYAARERGAHGVLTPIARRAHQRVSVSPSLSELGLRLKKLAHLNVGVRAGTHNVKVA
jgi:hypothetical protein